MHWIDSLVAFVSSVSNNYPDIKIVGICFGHQIVARAFGGECVPNPKGWEVGVTRVPTSPVGKEILGVDTLVRVSLLLSSGDED
jgi:GMP synthase-like glutamine amidotransferase